MKAHRALRTFVRWFLTTLTVVGVAASVFSTRRAVIWDSPGLRYEIGLALGAAHFAWRPAGWNPSTERYPSRPGWSIASYGGSPNLSWWFDSYKNKSWHGISIPLWILCLLIAVPTALAW